MEFLRTNEVRWLFDRRNKPGEEKVDEGLKGNPFSGSTCTKRIDFSFGGLANLDLFSIIVLSNRS